MIFNDENDYMRKKNGWLTKVDGLFRNKLSRYEYNWIRVDLVRKE